MVTQHIRGGVELAPLGQRQYYDYDYQVIHTITKATR